MTGNDSILVGLGVGLLVAMTSGTARGIHRGPVRALASLIALVAAGAAAWAFGGPLGRSVFEGTAVPWILRGAVGMIALATFVWLVVFGWIWWRGRNKNPSPDPEHPVSGAIVGCWVGILWYMVALMTVLALAGIGETWLSASGGKGQVPWMLRWPMRVKTALASRPGTEPISRLDPIPERPRRILRKAVSVMKNPAAFRRLQNDESVRALAAHPAFYPLINDAEIKEIVRRQDAEALISNPRVVALLRDEEFQQRLMEADVEPMLDRALARPATH